MGPLKSVVVSLRPQGAVGPLKKVASLQDPWPESPKMVGYTFYFILHAQNLPKWVAKPPIFAFLGMN